MRRFRTRSLRNSEKYVPLQRVFHSIRFKVNKGWSTAVLLFLCPYFLYFADKSLIFNIPSHYL